MSAFCKSCRTPVEYVEMAGKRTRAPLETVMVDDPIAYVDRHGVDGLVAVNPATGRGRAITTSDLLQLPAWLAQGVRVHVNHYARCPHAKQHRAAAEERRAAQATPCPYPGHVESWQPHPEGGVTVCFVCHPPAAVVDAARASGERLI